MRAISTIVTAAFALASVAHGAVRKAGDAMVDAQIHLYPFVTDGCTGQPFTSPYEMKQGQCVDMTQARSLRPRWRSDHADWIKVTNALRAHCKLETFSDFGCAKENRTAVYRNGLSGDMPNDLESCLESERQNFQKEGEVYHNDFYSAKFECGKLDSPEHICTTVIAHTTWSVDTVYGMPSARVRTKTFYGTIAVPGPDQDNVEKRDFEPKRESETKGVWMLHPWSHSVVCFLCYTRKAHDYNKMECRQGYKYPASCGPQPVDRKGKAITQVSTRTLSDGTVKFELKNDSHAGNLKNASSDTGLPNLDIELEQKGSWHAPIAFYHPFLDDKYACADSEWEKRGQVGQEYIKVQDVHLCARDESKKTQWIDFPPVDFDTFTGEKNSKTKRDTLSTSAPSKVMRHDQL